MNITLYGRPISKKNSRILLRRGGRVFNIPSDAFRRFQQHAVAELKKVRSTTKCGTITDKVALRLIFYQKGRMHQDIDNAVSSILDVLQEAKIIKDDDQVVSVSCEKWGGYKNWVTFISLEPVIATERPVDPQGIKLTGQG